MNRTQPENPDRDWSETYATQLLETITPAGPVLHLIIRRHDDKEIVANWTTIQCIKDDIFGSDIQAVEAYPPKARIVDEANRRHLWALPYSLPCGLHPDERT